MIRFHNLTAKQSGKTVLQSISGHIPRGQLTGIIGPNGAGKSTLARALLGLLPSTGQIHINGKSLAAHSRADIAKSIAYLPQGQDLHWPLSVERLVSLGRLPHLGPLARLRPADEQAIDAAMAKTGTLAMRHRCAAELSGGERARVMLARALAAATPALIADEPLASLDPGYQLDVIGLLREQCLSGTTIACVLHDLDIALRYCDNLILLAGGHILAHGPAAQVLTPENLAAAFGVTAIIDPDGQSLRITGRSPPP